MAVENAVPPRDGDTGTPLATEVETDRPDTEASHEVMNLLSQHVPLALLADLAIPSGPESPQILQDEGLPDVAWWEHEEDAETGEPSDASAAP